MSKRIDVTALPRDRRRAPFTLTLCAALFLAACHRETEDTPETALTIWVNAMNASRTDIQSRRRAFDLLSNRARESLTERAARASQLSGRDLQPWEMLAPGRFAMRFAFDPDGLETRLDGDHATVTARARAGDHAVVPMVREQGHWHVDLALPAMQTIQSGDDAGSSSAAPR